MSKSLSRPVTAQTQVMGIIGSSIRHSLSPTMHNFAAAELSIDCCYLAFDSFGKVFPEAEFFRVMWDINAIGFNITVPFKELAARRFASETMRSVNTLYRSEQGWQAASTDAEGFVLGLKADGIDLQQFGAVIILGNGGAAPALYDYLLDSFQKPIYVLRRNSAKDLQWKKSRENVFFSDMLASELTKLIYDHPHSLLIQTSSGPMHGDDLAHLIPGLSGFRGCFVDLVYGYRSAIYSELKRRSIPVQDGLNMLVGQAILSQKLWWSKSIDYEVLWKYLQQYLLARK